ncbi:MULTISPECIES: RadC family protein [Thiomicrorhabdus]|uniref:DNA repair protein RadC n=1 Tax=Thiomicrorhabdus heinhorstiae TaxID=2748010 RepID=A0ABS0BUV3_9GAMM|nr:MULTISPECIES: DNA repair protein RadC [Thiomicrorhabdus]MBF6057603.1 DNA repair protein RadC [Thiomicrorhabdus heinhorstiae]
MSIRDWHENDRPREKLLRFGAGSLSDAELLAIFLRVGIKGQSAVALAENLLTHFQTLPALLNASEAEFCQAKGLGQAKYVQLQAVLEMSKRHFESGLQSGETLSDPHSVARYLEYHIGHSQRERFGILLLNQQHQMIRYVTLFEGTLNQATVHPREILKLALDENAAAVILAHNHPSGDPTPSQADIKLTEAIGEALRLVDIRCLDHLIIGDKGRWHSMAQQRQMPS